MNRNTVVKALVAVAFFGMTVELRFLHRAMEGSWLGWVPTVAAAVGVLASLAALLRPRAARWVAVAIYLVCALGGPIGFYFHTLRNPAWFAELLTGRAPIAAQAGTGGSGTSVSRSTTVSRAPAIAPFALTGLSLIGLAVSWPPKKKRP